jgi:proton glutamate symport protein
MPSPDKTRINTHLARAISRWVTLGSLTGLVFGLAFGILLHGKNHPHLQSFLLSLQPLSALWLRALRFIVWPLVVCVLVVSIAPKDGTRSVGKMGGLTLICFSSILLLGALFSVAAAPILVRGLHVDHGLFASLHATLANNATQSAAAPLSHWSWVHSLFSSKLLNGIIAGRILPLMATTILFALLLRTLAPRHRDPLINFFNATRNSITWTVRMLLCALPAVAFVLIASVTSSTGMGVAKSIGYYLLAICGTLLAFTGVQYLIAWLVGGISLPVFARGVLPAQATAMATRSSLASLPALLDGAQNRVGLESSVATFVLPLSVSTFKASQTIFPTFKLIFLAHLFGVPLDPASVVAFIIGVFVLSFVTPGLPTAGSIHSIPLMLAVGIPLQGILLTNSVAEIPDIFETLLNVTADMTVATIVARFIGVSKSAAHAKARQGVLVASAVKFPG